MIKKILFTVSFLALVGFANAQFDPSVVKKSLVRVMVSINDKEANVCTGFVWKTPNQVVTSLHAMSPSGTIKVLYLNQAWRKAKIKKVLLKADLVLLEIIPGEEPIPAGVVPLTTFNDQPIKFGTEIFAMGYNSGATGSSSRTLKKGYVDPETLNNLIPKSDRDALKTLGFPDLNQNILYLEGSLLPGYSGSPVYDPQGKLVGIGDGGLEKGASNVSWIIPAKYLTELENSSVTSLPANFGQMAQLFSATVTVEASAEKIEELTEESGTDYGYGYLTNEEEEYVPVDAAGFEFYLTKSRSLVDMVETSDDPENLLKFATELEGFNVTLDYDNLRFDIYEDINYGVILAVPEGNDLYYDNATGYFAASFPEDSRVGLLYVGEVVDNSYTNFDDLTVMVQDWVNTSITAAYGISGFTTDETYSYWQEYDDGRKIAYISMAGNDPFYSADGSVNAVGLYITVLMSPDKTFISVSSYLLPVDLIQSAATYGLDCVNPVYYQECDYFESLMKVFCASHLTTFAY
jgi:hypothetical protein